jgi:hypothetical protein
MELKTPKDDDGNSVSYTIGKITFLGFEEPCVYLKLLLTPHFKGEYLTTTYSMEKTLEYTNGEVVTGKEKRFCLEGVMQGLKLAPKYRDTILFIHMIYNKIKPK